PESHWSRSGAFAHISHSGAPRTTSAAIGMPSRRIRRPCPEEPPPHSVASPLVVVVLGGVFSFLPGLSAVRSRPGHRVRERQLRVCCPPPGGSRGGRTMPALMVVHSPACSLAHSLRCYPPSPPAAARAAAWRPGRRRTPSAACASLRDARRCRPPRRPPAAGSSPPPSPRGGRAPQPRPPRHRPRTPL